MLGIVVALPGEKNTLGKAKKYNGTVSQLGDRSLVVVSGAGPANAHKAGQLLITHGVTALLSWGCAGALDDTLQPGDLIIPKLLKSPSGEQCSTDPSWSDKLIKHLSKHLKLYTGAIVQSERLVTTAADKARLFHAEKAIAVDMESFTLAILASEAQRPFMAIRAIADPATMALPQSVVNAMNTQGEVELPALLRHLIKKPSELTALIRLGLNFRAAQRTLKRVSKLAPAPCYPKEASTSSPKPSFSSR